MSPHRPSQLWSAGILAVAFFSFPYVMLFTALSKLWRRLFVKAPTASPAPTTRTAIVTGGKMTKAYCVCRQLKQSGCRVVLVETHKYWMVASRQASCVDRFVTVPVPEQDPEGYLQALKVLAYEEDADLFVPVSSPVASVYDARVHRVLPPRCRSLSIGEYWTQALDDKVTFSELARMAKLAVPDTVRITSKEELHAFNEKLHSQKSNPYILKNLAYDSMRRLDLFKLPCDTAALTEYVADVDITESTPWTCQEFISGGDEYSTCAIAHEGKLTMYTDNSASISCFNYKYQGDERLKSWVTTFCEHYNISGVVCIDFLIDPLTGVAKSIECNPRFSSNITNFYNRDDVGRAYLEPEALIAKSEVITPLASAQETCWTATELYYNLTKPGMSLVQRMRGVYETFFVKKDAYWDPDDVMPFLALHYLHIPTLLWRNIRRGNRWAKIDMCIGKLTEENGD